jgi:hypothetical protein
MKKLLGIMVLGLVSSNYTLMSEIPDYGASIEVSSTFSSKI